MQTRPILPGIALVALGLASGLAAVTPVVAQPEPIELELGVPERPFAFLPGALADAAGTGTLTVGSGVDELTLGFVGLPPEASYNIFLAESGAAPFGALQYLADIESDEGGAADVTVETAVLDAFALRGVASDGRLDPAATNDTRVDLDHLVVWPKDSETLADVFAEQDQDAVATPFDDDGEAGPAVLTTASGDGPGPLAAQPAAERNAAATAATVAVREDSELGSFLTDAAGMTLYRFTKDAPNESTCYDDCAAAWPPFAAEDAPLLPEGVGGELGTITREDGIEQVTYDGLPLYYWAADQEPGDATGHGVNDVWFVVEPVAS